ncbi:MAG TPA: S8 family serine peptidase, partial [Nevskiaceae bacterium]|nr:S8 family serine peptidase [Nevskiaceae bacterium]
SFSAPYVAGLAALLKQKFPAATPAELRARLIESAEPVGNTGRLTVGGRVDADAALEIAARPSIVVRSVRIDAAGNAVLDPGETATVRVVLENLWLDATGVTVDATATTVGETPARTLIVEGGPVTIGALARDGTATADFTVRIPGNMRGHHYLDFAFAITADGGYTATRHYADEVSELGVDTEIEASFVGLDNALDDDFHAYHITLDHDLVNEDLVIRTQANPDIDLLVKYGERPVYDIALGADPESSAAIFCTSGDNDDCLDDDTAISGEADGFEAVRYLNARAGTYYIVVANFELQRAPLPYTISASAEPTIVDDDDGGGGGAMGVGTVAGLLGFGLLAAWARRRAARVSARAAPR